MPAIQSKSLKQAPKTGTSSGTHVAIIGAGRGGTALMEIFATDPLVTIVWSGIAGRGFHLLSGYSRKKENKLRNRLGIGLIALLFLLAMPVLAQINTGIISGRVTDPSGAVVRSGRNP